MKLSVNYPDTPAGKRSVRINIYGNVVGYVSGRRFWEFGPRGGWNQMVADLWADGATLEQADTGEAK
jgi:hypothetical protein